MTTEKRDAITPGTIESYPVLPLRDIVVFPHMMLPQALANTDKRVAEAQKIIDSLRAEQARGNYRIAQYYDKKKRKVDAVVEHEEKLRQQINHLDDELMQILGQRMKIAEKIGEYKKNNNITILQTNRWNEILDRAFGRGEKLGLSKEFVTRYLDAVHMESINHQNKVMND